MSHPAGLEQLVDGAARSGWEWFGGVDERVQKALLLDAARTDEDKRAIARAWADFAETPGGRKALEAMFDTTLRRTVFFASLGVDPMSMAVFGAFREGQNALAHEIARQIATGRADDPPKPRDT